MGLAMGGQIQQKVYPDPHGLQVWDQTHSGCLAVYILNSQEYTQVTGQPPPFSPVSAQTYTEYGFPWFELYDEDRLDLLPGSQLQGLQSVSQVDQERGIPPAPEESPLEIDDDQVIHIDPQK